MSEPIYVGIDPGKDGAIAAIFPDGNVVIRDLPFGTEGKFDCRVFKLLVEEFGDDLMIIFEEPFNKWGRAKTMFMNAGKVLGVIESLGHRVMVVAASRWKTKMGLSKAKKDSIELAKVLYPEVEESGALQRGVRVKKDSHDRCEALLLAHCLKDRLIWD